MNAWFSLNWLRPGWRRCQFLALTSEGIFQHAVKGLSSSANLASILLFFISLGRRYQWLYYFPEGIRHFPWFHAHMLASIGEKHTRRTAFFQDYLWISPKYAVKKNYSKFTYFWAKEDNTYILLTEEFSLEAFALSHSNFVKCLISKTQTLKNPSNFGWLN